MAGPLTGTYGLPGRVTGLGKLSRLRFVTGGIRQLCFDDIEDRDMVGVLVRNAAAG